MVPVDTRAIRERIDDLEKLNKDVVKLISPSHNLSHILPEFNLNIQRIRNNFQTLRSMVHKKRFRRETTGHLNNLAENHNLLVNTTSSTLKAALQKLETNFQRLQEALKNIDNFVSRANVQFIMNQFSHIQQQVDAQISELQNAILLARRNIMHPSVITPSRLLEFYDAKFRFWTDIRSLFDHNLESMAGYLDLCTISTDFVGEELQFTITIPIIFRIGYDLYELHEFPKASEHNTYTYIKPTDNYLLINITDDSFVFLGSLSNCKQIEKAVWICTSLLEEKQLKAKCETSILAKLPLHCTSHEYSGEPDVWYHLKDNQWAFAQPTGAKLNVVCDNGTFLTVSLPTNGILNLCQCYASPPSGKRIFHYRSIYNSSIQSATSISKFVPKIAVSAFPNYLPVLETFDSSMFQAVIDQLKRQLESLQQFSNDTANRQTADSAMLQATFSQLAQLNDTLEHSIVNISRSLISQNSTIDLVLTRQRLCSTQLQNALDRIEHLETQLHSLNQTFQNASINATLKMQDALHQFSQLETLRRIINTIKEDQESMNASINYTVHNQTLDMTQLKNTLEQLQVQQHQMNTSSDHQIKLQGIQNQLKELETQRDRIDHIIEDQKGQNASLTAVIEQQKEHSKKLQNALDQLEQLENCSSPMDSASVKFDFCANLRVSLNG
ncbi:hypothetical protein V9T40_003796 [Parthenolecanium corni]|uniref:Uncharacterized protein n=1 Tax=Parthenolecanium corni TaxID=536013 RepID=A0AAN9YAF8_9HEMI